MPVVTEVLPDFDGFAVQYDVLKNPFFRAIMVENLRKLAEVELGKDLLKQIAGARPRSRGTFLPSVNVLCVPGKVEFVQSGYKWQIEYGQGSSILSKKLVATDNPGYNVKGCPFHIDGGSHNEAVDTSSTGNGVGSVCYMRFANTQVVTRKGERTLPFIVLAHELIHSLHCLTGQIHLEEEPYTTGIGQYADNPMSENGFRKAFNLPLRTKYY